MSQPSSPPPSPSAPSTSTSTSPSDSRTSNCIRHPTARLVAGSRQNPVRSRKRRRTQVPASDDEEQPETEHDGTSQPSTQPTKSATTNLTGAALKKALFDERFEVATNTPEKVLALMMEGWTSAVYDHFILPPMIVADPGKEVKHRFPCKDHPDVYVTRVYYDESTSNLNRHVGSCEHEDTAQSRAFTAYVKGSSYNPGRHRLRLVIWIARRARSYSILDDTELHDIFHDLHDIFHDLHDIFHDLHAPCVSPSHHTLSRDIVEVHGLTKDALTKMLAGIDSKIHVMADGWTSPNSISFIGVNIQYVNKGVIKSLVLDFVRLMKAHTGTYLASKLAECLQEFGIDDRILGFTGDNASNNDTLVSELEVLLPAFRGDEHRVRCACHILNLVAKAILSAFAQKVSDADLDSQAALNELEDELLENEYVAPTPESDRLAPEVVASDASAVNDIIDSIEADLEGRIPAMSPADATLARLALTKLRKLAVKISHSPLLRDSLFEWCDHTKIDRRLLQKDVSTRWNSTAELSASGRHLRPALDRMVVQAEFNKPSGVRLRRFKPTDAEWTVLDQLAPLLETINYATKELSRSAVPLVHEVIPIIDVLTQVFDETIDNTNLHIVVRHAALRGARMLNKYYAKTDDSVVYRIAMMLHPHYKLEYFSQAKWEASWITEARRIITKVWNDHYKPATLSTTTPQPSTSSTADRFAGIRERFNLHRGATSSRADALEEWFATPPVAMNIRIDPIKYWSDMKLGGHPLAQMALDYLSTPATSTDVERVFSRGGLTVSKLRHALSDSSVRCQTVLGVWCQVPGLLPFDDIAHMFNNKSKRGKKRLVEESETEHEVIDVEDD